MDWPMGVDLSVFWLKSDLLRFRFPDVMWGGVGGGEHC